MSSLVDNMAQQEDETQMHLALPQIAGRNDTSKKGSKEGALSSNVRAVRTVARPLWTLMGMRQNTARKGQAVSHCHVAKVTAKQLVRLILIKRLGQ